MTSSTLILCLRYHQPAPSRSRRTNTRGVHVSILAASYVDAHPKK